jgi:hypothetical protein
VKNPFRTRYRIVERPCLQEPFEPQVWRWYWPFWRALVWGSATGHDHSPWSYKTIEEALMKIDWDRHPARRHVLTVHKVP